jgi:proline iminopeptidase
MVRRVTIFLVLIALSGAACAQSISFEGTKRVNGTQLFVKVLGKGEPLLVVHGGPGMNHTYFLPHVNTLAKKFKLIYYDQRASGQSAVPHPDSISLDFFVEDIEALRKEFKIDKLHVLAHSWGAIPVIQYALDYPDRVKKIVFVNPVPLSTEYNAELAELQKKRLTKQDSIDRSQLLASSEFKEGKSEAYRKLLMLSFRHSFFKAANYNKMQFTMPSNYVEASRALFTGLGKDLSQYNYYESIKELNVPVLLIHGAADVTTPAIQSRATDAIKQSRLVVFKASGHFSFIDETEHFRKEVTAFYQKK